MTVAQYFVKLRQAIKDNPILTGEAFDGDGATTAFRTRNAPIIEGGYTVKIGTAVQVETTHYTIDLDSGVLVFLTAPTTGDNNITITYKYAKLRDAQMLDILNGIISEMKGKLWADKLDSTTITTVANQSEYSLDTLSTDIFRVIGVWIRSSSTVDWSAVSSGTNIEFWREANKLNVRPYFGTTGYALKIRYLENYSEYSATTETITIPDNYLRVITAFFQARFVDEIISLQVINNGAVVKETTYQATNNLLNIKTNLERQAETMLRRIKPRVPSTTIASLQYGLTS